MSEGRKFWLITVAALLALATTLSLGRWQLSRAADKAALQASIDARGRQPALDGRTLGGQEALAAGLLHRRIVLRGRWLAGHTVFLDNRQMQGQPGFYVLTPLQIEGSSTVVLVQRGWVARNFVERTQLPRIETPQGAVEIGGRIVPAPSRLYQFDDAATGPIRQNLDLAQFAGETGLPLLTHLSIQQTDPAAGGLRRDWPEIGLGIDKHYGYAFQWFGLSALIAILYVWFQVVKRYIARRPR